MSSSLSKVHVWAIAAGANLTRPRGDKQETLALSESAASAQESLGTWWNVHSPAEVDETLAWLRKEGHTVRLHAILRGLSSLPEDEVDAYIVNEEEWPVHQARYAWKHRFEFRDGGLEAFDMVRLSFIARAGFTAGWLSKRAAWDAVFEAANRLQKGHGSWQEMSQNYLLGRRFWAGGDPKVQVTFDKFAKWLETSEKSPWHPLPWYMPLKPNFWNRYP